MPTNVLGVGLFAVTAAFMLTGLWFLKLKPFNGENRRTSDHAFALAIGAVGIYAFIAGFYLMAGSPLNPPYNEFFGTIHLYYGMVLIIGALSVGMSWDLRPASYLAFLGGMINVLYIYINETLIHNVSYSPIFAAAALVGLSAPAATHVRSVWASRVTGIFCIALAFVALYLGWNAFIGHIARGLKPS